MKRIQEAVQAYLEYHTGIPAVADRTREQGRYPLLAVSVQEKGTVLLAGGKLAEHTYHVTVTAASDRLRDDNMAILSPLSGILLHGIPMESKEGVRTLHPLNISTEGEALTFSLELCVPVPPLPTHSSSATETMETLHLGVSE